MEPKIRFKGFEGEWKEEPLKTFFTKVTKKNTKMQYSAVLTNSAEHGIIDQRDYFDFDVANSNNIGGYYIVEPNDFVYNPRVSVTAPVGPINRNRLGYAGVMSPLYLVFKIDGINKDYLCNYYKTNKWHQFMRLSGNCGARFDRLSISDEQFVTMPIPHPSNLKEQQVICKHLDTLDSQISASTSRLASLKQMKAASLQAMFPQEGETMPKIRFKGFEGEWKKVVIGNIGSTYSGLSGKGKEDFGIGEAKYITFLNVLTNAQIDTSILENVDIKESEHQNEVKKGDLFFNTSSETPEEVGMCSVLDEEVDNVYLNSFCFGFRITNSCVYPKYIAYLMRSKVGRRIMSILAQGATRFNLSKKYLCKAEIPIPTSLAEQQAIASYFTSLDRQISLQSQRLEKLKQIKSACLDKMFV